MIQLVGPDLLCEADDMGKRRHVIQRCRNLWEKRWPKMRLDIETADIKT